MNILYLIISLIVYTSENSTIKEAVVKDVNNNEYKYIETENHYWMAENLKTAHFNNGDTIFHAKTKEDWDKAWKQEMPAWCNYKYDDENDALYGKMYNWFAVTDERKLAPQEWNIPSGDDWEELVKEMGGMMSAGEKLKDTLKWEPYMNQIHSCNSSGFSALPGGVNRFGKFYKLGLSGYWWGVPIEGKRDVSGIYLENTDKRVKTNIIMSNRADAYYVRCVRTKN